jgi:YegS/Rv2252/BmrU family lipid kinase
MARGCDRLIVVGGDGTVQETAVALEGSDVAVGIVRAGTGNDFSRTHLIPRDPAEALALACGGKIREFDLGRVNGHLFVNIAGLGFDAEVAAFCHNRFRKAGPVIYIFGVFAQLMGFSPQMLTFTLDGKRFEQRCLFLAVGNGRYYGGGMMMCPRADPSDGLFDVCVGGNLGKLETLRLLTMVFSGRHVGQPGITIYRAKRVVVDSPAPLSVHADGEPVGRVPAEFALADGRLRLVVPS